MPSAPAAMVAPLAPREPSGTTWWCTRANPCPPCRRQFQQSDLFIFGHSVTFPDGTFRITVLSRTSVPGSSRVHQSNGGLMFKAIAFALLALAPAPLWAQFGATLQGVVTDSSGGAVPGATVTLTNNETRQKLTGSTSGEGVY